MRQLLPKLVIVFLGYILLLSGLLALSTPPPMPRILGTALFLAVVLVLPCVGYLFVLRRSRPGDPFIKHLTASVALSLLSALGLFCWVCFLRFGL